MISIQPFRYSDSTTPDGYSCGDCNASGVRLYRLYQTFLDNQKLRCEACAKKNQEGKKFYDKSKHTIGWMVAAVPMEDGSSFWGFTSVPDEGVKWWDALPCSVFTDTELLDALSNNHWIVKVNMEHDRWMAQHQESGTPVSKFHPSFREAVTYALTKKAERKPVEKPFVCSVCGTPSMKTICEDAFCNATTIQAPEYPE